MVPQRNFYKKYCFNFIILYLQFLHLDFCLNFRVDIEIRIEEFIKDYYIIVFIKYFIGIKCHFILKIDWDYI